MILRNGFLLIELVVALCMFSVVVGATLWLVADVVDIYDRIAKQSAAMQVLQTAIEGGRQRIVSNKAIDYNVAIRPVQSFEASYESSAIVQLLRTMNIYTVTSLRDQNYSYVTLAAHYENTDIGIYAH